MPQYAVIAYQIEVSTAPRPRQHGVPPPELIPAVYIQIQGTTTLHPLPVESTTEFMAICQLLQTPGRLLYDPDQQKVQKFWP